MEYTVDKLARLSGVSSRTLRYYDQIGLLRPKQVRSNGYRIYGQAQVDLLQQILFYRELDIGLEQIKAILESKEFDRIKALEKHLTDLTEKREHLDELIATVRKTIGMTKGEYTMSDTEKFEGFKQKLVRENDEKYGAEVRRKYGEDAADASNAKFLKMAPAEYDAFQSLSQKINEKLKEAVMTGNPAGAAAQEACRLHQDWIKTCWGKYSKEAHLGLCRMYVEDERFAEYYEKVCIGGAKFLLQAMEIYLA